LYRKILIFFKARSSKNVLNVSGTNNINRCIFAGLFSEDDSEDSTQQEDEEDDEDESDGNDSDEREALAVPATASGGAAGGANPSSVPGGNPGTPAQPAGTAAPSNTAPVAEQFSMETDEPLFERRSAVSGNPASVGTPRGNLAPVSMQWAIRSRDPTGVSRGGLVFIDHTSATLRRSAATNAVAAAAAAASSQDSVTMATTASGLARAFGIIMR
jgi:E3 ubiquitin-protein ligase EDD1